MFVGIQRGPLGISKEIDNGDFAEKTDGFNGKYQDDPHRNGNGNQRTGHQAFFNNCLFYFLHRKPFIAGTGGPGVEMDKGLLIVFYKLLKRGNLFGILCFG